MTLPCLKAFMQGSMVVVEAEVWVPNPGVDLSEQDPDPTNATLTDPTTVVYTARKDGAGTASTYTYGVEPEVTRVSVGVFELRIVPVPGLWTVHVQGTGAAYAADDIRFRITPSGAFVPA